MKIKLHSLIVLIFACATWLQAQQSPAFKQQFEYSKKTNAKMEALNGHIPDIPLDETGLIAAPSKEDVVSFRANAAFSVRMGSSYNVYSVVSEGPNAVSYHPEIDAIVFSHRQNFPAPGGSGIISFDVSTDVGATWDTVTKQVTPNLITADGIPINGNRYPNGAIYNPPGNTDPSNAYFVGTGAALWNDPAFGNGWGWEFVASSRFDGSEVNEAYYSTADTNIYLSAGMVYTDDAIWYGNYRREQNFAHQLYNPLIVTKLEFDEGTNSFVRTAKELPLDFSAGVDSSAVEPRVAFAPDGQIGYATILGIDADDTEIYPSWKPIVWKTTDGGDTWEKQARMMYQELDSLIAWTIPIDGDGDGTSDDPASDSPRVPFMSQYDIAVDVNGQLHVMASMLSSTDTATTAADFGFIWAGPTSTELFHFIGKESGWEAHRVSDWYNEDGPIGGENIDERIHASRTPDGEYVFMTFSKTYYQEIMEEMPNISPDIYGYAYRVSDEHIVRPKNYGLEPGTEFNDFEFTDVAAQGYFHMTAPVAILGGEFWDQELPIVYGIPRDASDDLQPIDYWFLRSAGFDNDEYEPLVVSVDEPKELTSFSIFPNPANAHVTVQFGLEAGTRYQLRLMNAIGQTINVLDDARAFGGLQYFELDASQLTSGLYFVHLQTDTGLSTKKLVVK
jgi:hypothetical protein